MTLSSIKGRCPFAPGQVVEVHGRAQEIAPENIKEYFLSQDRFVLLKPPACFVSTDRLELQSLMFTNVRSGSQKNCAMLFVF